MSLTTSLISWGKVICCLCAGFHVALTPVEAPCHCQSATPSEATPFSYWSIKPWFYCFGKTFCCAHHTFSLGVPNSATHINSKPGRLFGTISGDEKKQHHSLLPHQLGAQQLHLARFFWRHCRGESSLLQGESLTHNLFYFFTVF